MHLFLVQHGETTSEDIDPSRPLTEKGRTDVSKVADFMERSGVKAEEIWHSDKLRAKQTAEIIAKILGTGKIIEKEGLAPNDPIAKYVEIVNGSSKDLMIIGHLPFLAKLSSSLLAGSGSGGIINFKQGIVVCLEKCDYTWGVAWMVGPELV